MEHSTKYSAEDQRFPRLSYRIAVSCSFFTLPAVPLPSLSFKKAGGSNEFSLQINEFKSTTNLIFAATNRGVLPSKHLGTTRDWIFSEGAIFELAVSENGIYEMDFFGGVFRSPLQISHG